MSGYFLPHIAAMSGYIPGEQPRESGILKLNTNENPYPPSPKVAEAVLHAFDGRLRRYPDPVGTQFRQSAARKHGVNPSQILVGNGSDDLLTIITRAFVAPGDVVACPTPSYILYRTLAELQNARTVEIPFDASWSIPAGMFAAAKPKLAFLANPNSPSGTCLSPNQVAGIAGELSCPLVVDEAYVDFAETECVELVAKHDNVIVTRTLSKGSSLAGLRVGYLIARPEIVEGLIKVKDSYNCDTLSLIGGTAALEDTNHLMETRGKILTTRARLAQEMRRLGYHVPESHANFVWCEGGPPARPVYEALKARKILVRLMSYPGRAEGLRITVGTDDEIDTLLIAMREILR